MKKLTCVLFIILSCFVSSAFAFFASANIRDGRYYNPKHRFSVQVPKIDSLKITEINEGGFHNVIFEPRYGYWMNDAKYTVDFLDRPRPRKTPDDVMMKLIPKAMMKILESHEYGSVKNVSKPQCRYVKAAGKRAYQCVYRYIAFDNMPTLFVGTLIPVDGGIVNVYGLEINDSRHSFNWTRYNAMLNSIQVYPVQRA